MDHTDHDVPSGLSWARKGEGGYIAIFVVVLQKKCNEFCTFKCALTYTLMIQNNLNFIVLKCYFII